MKQCDNESIFVGCNGKIEGLLEVNRDFCKQQMAEKAFVRCAAE